MADYKELLRRAVEALPENNGAARRAVYEKARSALVGQLRGLNPPLAARDITQHRLQLEDCIRQVEQEASEAVISGLRQQEQPAQPAPAFTPQNRPAPVTPARPAPAAATATAKPAEPPKPASKLSGKAKPVAASIEDIIAAAGDDYEERNERVHEPEGYADGEEDDDEGPAEVQPAAKPLRPQPQPQ
ncbi:MAG: hypothetical protein JWN11_88, partial [Hyphomicrobiales bacterium]|nr:hypothetical protein [Hyphomicrobiales bacterium]